MKDISADFEHMWTSKTFKRRFSLGLRGRAVTNLGANFQDVIFSPLNKHNI